MAAPSAKLLLLVPMAVALAGCASVSLVRRPEVRTSAPPSYEASRGIFFWGLMQAEPDLALDQICLGKDVDQVTFVTTPMDVLETVITLGVFSPRTVRIWCEL